MKILMIILSLTMVTTAFADTSDKNADKARMEATSHSKLDDLIRGEMAAVETYSQVIGKVKDPKEKQELTAIRDNHKNAVEKLQKHANRPVKNDAKDSGVWGSFAKAWTGGAKIFGEDAAVNALKQGEEHGKREYERLLEDEKVSKELKEIVRTDLMPKQDNHIKTLEKNI